MKSSFAIVTLSAAVAACGVAPPQHEPQAARAPLSPAAKAASDAVYVLARAELDASQGNWQQAVDALMGAAREQRDARLAKRAGEIAADYGSMPDSAAAARLRFEIEPSAEAADAHARASLAAGDYVSAAATFGQIVGRASDATRGDALRYTLGWVSAFGESAAHAGVLEQVAEPYAELPEAQVMRAEAARWRGDMAAARAHAARALELDARSPMAALALAQASEGAQGLDVLARFLAANPDQVAVREAYALQLLSHGRAYDARRELLRLLEAQPEDEPLLLYLLGLVEMRTGDVQSAQRRLERVVELDAPNRNKAIVALATLAQDRGDFEAAARWLDQARPGEDEQDLQFTRAAVTAARGDIEGARRLLAAIPATSDPVRVKLIVAEAGMLSQAGESAAGYAMLKDGVQQFPDNHELLYVYALAAEQAGHMDEAERSLRLLIRRAPGDAQMLNALGYMFADRKIKLKEARQLLTEAMRLAPGAEAVIDSMGWLEYRSGNLKAAERLLRTAWGKRRDGDIGAHLAEVLWQRGKKAEARKVLREVKRVQPDSRVFRDTLARLGVKL